MLTFTRWNLDSWRRLTVVLHGAIGTGLCQGSITDGSYGQRTLENKLARAIGVAGSAYSGLHVFESRELAPVGLLR